MKRVTNLTDRSPHPDLAFPRPATIVVGSYNVPPGGSVDIPDGLEEAFKALMGSDIAIGDVPAWYRSEAPKGRKKPKKS